MTSIPPAPRALCTVHGKRAPFLLRAAVHGSRAAESLAREVARVPGPQSTPAAPGESQSRGPLLHRTGTRTLAVQPSETPEGFRASPP